MVKLISRGQFPQLQWQLNFERSSSGILKIVPEEYLTEPAETMLNLSHLPSVQFMSREDFSLLEPIESPWSLVSPREKHKLL